MSSRQLFRQQAIEFQRGQREFGEIALLQPVSTKLLAWLLAAVVTIAIVFLCFAQFSRKQTVSGFLTPAAGTLKVFPDREGVVANLYVKEGQQVKAGEPPPPVDRQPKQASRSAVLLKAAADSDISEDPAAARSNLRGSTAGSGEQRPQLLRCPRAGGRPHLNEPGQPGPNRSAAAVADG